MAKEPVNPFIHLGKGSVTATINVPVRSLVTDDLRDLEGLDVRGGRNDQGEAGDTLHDNSGQDSITSASRGDNADTGKAEGSGNGGGEPVSLADERRIDDWLLNDGQKGANGPDYTIPQEILDALTAIYENVEARAVTPFDNIANQLFGEEKDSDIAFDLFVTSLSEEARLDTDAIDVSRLFDGAGSGQSGAKEEGSNASTGDSAPGHARDFNVSLPEDIVNAARDFAASFNQSRAGLLDSFFDRSGEQDEQQEHAVIDPSLVSGIVTQNDDLPEIGRYGV